ncbi:MAG: hypothetical protein IPP89_14305 [Saprospiraceae bacterium]|nr:hypothetical protein [Candidatus Brachybacter algidus]MBL0120109.1 hypothetical protein [Candidatus Brachybacter algidus]
MDLYGTMQMREEKYVGAAKTLNQIPAEYWHTGVIEYDTYLDANPMHTLIFIVPVQLLQQTRFGLLKLNY